MLKRLLFLFSITAVNLVNADPFPLTEKTLDQISAGTVELTVNASAQSAGRGARNIAITNVNIEEQPADGSGNILTISTGEAVAYSRGEQVSTEVGYELTVTDENIVSFTIEQTLSSGVVSNHGKRKTRGKKKFRNNKNSKKHNQHKSKKTKNRRVASRKHSNRRPTIIEQQQTLTLRVVTVQSN